MGAGLRAGVLSERVRTVAVVRIGIRIGIRINALQIGGQRPVCTRRTVPMRLGRWRDGVSMSGVIMIARRRGRRTGSHGGMHGSAEQHRLRGIALRGKREDEEPGQGESQQAAHGRQFTAEGFDRIGTAPYIPPLDPVART